MRSRRIEKAFCLQVSETELMSLRVFGSADGSAHRSDKVLLLTQDDLEGKSSRSPGLLLSYLPLYCGIVVQDAIPSTVIEKQSIIFLKSFSPENGFSVFYKRCSITKM